MKWWNRLILKLPFFLLIIATVPLAVFGISTIRDFRLIRLQSIASIHRNMAQQSAETVENFLTDTIKEIYLVVHSSELESADISDQEWHLQLLIRNIPHLQTMTICGPDGQEKVKVGRDSAYGQNDLGKNTSLQTFINSVDPTPTIGPLRASDGHNLLLDIYLPLLTPHDRKVSDILVAEIDIVRFLNFTKDIQVGNTGIVYVVNEEGKLLVYPDHSAVLAGEDDSDNPLVKAFVAGRKANAVNQTYLDRHQNEVFTNAQAVKEPKLLVVVTQSVDEALGAVSRVSKRQITSLTAVIIMVILFSLYFAANIIKPLRRLTGGTQQITAGDLSHRIEVISSDELGIVTQSFNTMAHKLETARENAEAGNWLETGAAELENQLRGDQDLQEICINIITFMSKFLKQQVGVIYAHDGDNTFRYQGGYAFQPGENFLQEFQPGEGLPGEAARDKRIIRLSEIPEEHITINSGIGTIVPRHMAFIPFIQNRTVEAVIELGSFVELSDLEYRFFTEIEHIVAIKISSARARQELEAAFERSRLQAEELSGQQEELQAANEELEEQTQLLSASERKLKEQREELQAANEELEEKTEYLQRNKRNIEEKNQALELLKLDLERKAEDLSIASKYKSEFLANMSHELRTPLNSLLLLAKMLVDNREGNLTDEQVESSQIIYKSGVDLLELINEILDLSKIEAGKMQLNIVEISTSEIGTFLINNFMPLAEEKGLSLEVSEKTDSATISSDLQRIQQILKNFVANAIKFTSQGGVSIDIFQPERTTVFSRPELTSENTIGIAVRDTGIGIPADKKKIVFEAFQQLEGGSSRKYGGTGLGLSISKELANLLEGEIQLQSEEHVGSTFTLYLPREIFNPPAVNSPSSPETENSVKTATVSDMVPKGPGTISDDRNASGPLDTTVLIIEDDIKFASTLQLFCRKKGFKTIVCVTGEEGLRVVEKYPVKAVILDINLPGIDGWKVLEALKENPSTRHIPVHFMSSNDPVSNTISKKAIGHITKPVRQEELEKALNKLESIINKNMKDLLLVEDNDTQRRSIASLISDSNQVSIHEASSGREAIDALGKKHFDCMILDLKLPDMTGFDLLRSLKNDSRLDSTPVIIYTGRDLTREENYELRQFSDSIVIKGERSEERLLDETSLFLHQVVEKMPEEKRRIITAMHDIEEPLQGRNILIVDDDMRNVFALSRVLNQKKINTIKAESGRKALDILDSRCSEVDLILMDIMMPGMDGYETIGKIKEDSRFSHIPIIALTAKAMQKDKDKCIEAGANDYLAKPVETSRLLSMMRVWLYR